MMIAEIRHNIVKHPEDMGQIQELINQWREEQPGLSETELLQGELLIAYGNPEEARRILKGLGQRQEIPLWVAQQAKELLSQIP